MGGPMNTVVTVMRRTLPTAVMLALQALTPMHLCGQTILVPEPEAPLTIFQTKLGDAEVDLNLQGSWDAALGLGFGLLFAPGLPVQLLDAFPSMDVGFVFRQSPDVTASIVLMNSYFLDLSVRQDPLTQGFGSNTLVLGYRGEAPGVVRSVILGNGGIEISPSEFLQVPAQPASSLGASALLVSGVSANEFLLRWDSAEERSKTFMGKSELLEETVPLDSYIRGRFFFLPDSGVDSGDFSVYIEDPHKGTITADDGKVYRKAGIDDVSLDANEGTVALKALQKGRVLVFYRKGGLAIGHSTLGAGALPGENGSRRDLAQPPMDFRFIPAAPYVQPDDYLGQDMSFRRVKLSGVDCLLLWEPGDNSPFEIDSSYAFENLPPEDPARIRFRLEAKQAGVALPEVDFRALPDRMRFEVFVDPDLRADFHNMYPFPDPDGLLYGPLRDSLDGYLTYEIRVQLLNPAGEIVLEPDIVPGSVRVFVNGIAETRFQADPASGRLTFQVEIHDTDRIDVHYRVSSTGFSGGDILFAWRDTMSFSDALILTLAAGIRWNADPWSFSQKPYSKSGTVIAQAGLQGSGENWSYSVIAGLAYTNPDTSGLLRLFGMEGNSLIPELAEENAYPAAPPDGSAAGAPPGLTQGNRGILYYKDYRSYDVLGGSTLNPITWPGFASTDYVDGGRMGPYNVLGSPSGSGSGSSLVFDFSLSPGQWAGAQIPVIPGSTADLSAARTVTIQYRTRDVTGDFDLYLQAGGLSEDIDGNDVLNAETSATDPGFSFSEQTQDITLRVGGGPKGEGNGRLDSEDRNVNGILDEEFPDRTVTFPIAAPATASTWRTATYDLTSDDRSRLVDARQLRIVVVSAGGAEAKLVIGRISFQGAAEYGAVTAPGGSFTVRETAEAASANDPGSGSRLPEDFPEVNAFHPSGEIQEVLEAEWEGILSPLVITGFTGVGTGGIHYGKIGLYLRMPDALPGTMLGFSLTDAEGNGISWTVDSAALSRISAGPWHEMEVASADGRIRVDGIDIDASAPPVFDPGYGSLLKLTVTVSDAAGSGPPADGVLVLDEIRCMDPAGAFGAALSAEAAVEFPEVWKSGDFEILSNLSVRQKLTLISPGFSPLYGVPAAHEDMYSLTELGVDALYTQLKLDLLLREYAGDFTASGGHRITVPSFSFPVNLTDAFSMTWIGEFSRENSVEIHPLDTLFLTLGAKADATEEVLNQRWNGKISFAPAAPLSMSAEAEAQQNLSGYPLPSVWYAQSWIQEMGLVLPWPGGRDLSRREKLAFSAGLLPAPFGFQASAEARASSSDFTTEQYEQESGADLGLKLLLRLGNAAPDIVTVSLGYGRTVVLRTTESAGERFVSEADAFASVIGAQTYLLTGIPYLELFQDDATELIRLWASSSQASYEPKAMVSIQRGFGSRLWDLFLPSSVDLTVGRSVRLDGNLWATEISIMPKVANHALNLFGQLGSHPLVPFVRTDEYGISLGAAITSTGSSEFRLERLSADVFASMEGFGNEKMSVIQSFQWEEGESTNMTDTTRLEFDWNVRPPGGLSIPLLPPEMGKSAFLAHKEAFEAVVRFSDPGSYHALTFSLEHSTALVLPENGSITAKAGLGYDLENLLRGAFASRIGVVLEVEAKLSF